MEFNKKLQELRKQKNITQEQLANELFVSRTAISKWESGRGLPSIDSLKAIATFFDTTVDKLLSSDELLFLAQEDTKQKQKHTNDLLFGLLDVFTLIFLFLPFWAQRDGGTVTESTLLNLPLLLPYLKITYFVLIILITACGILTLAAQNCANAFWCLIKSKLSLIFNLLAVVVFISSLQPYPAILLLAFLSIKLLIKKN